MSSSRLAPRLVALILAMPLASPTPALALKQETVEGAGLEETLTHVLAPPAVGLEEHDLNTMSLERLRPVLEDIVRHEGAAAEAVDAEFAWILQQVRYGGPFRSWADVKRWVSGLSPKQIVALQQAGVTIVPPLSEAAAIPANQSAFHRWAATYGLTPLDEHRYRMNLRLPLFKDSVVRRFFSLLARHRVTHIGLHGGAALALLVEGKRVFKDLDLILVLPASEARQLEGALGQARAQLLGQRLNRLAQALRVEDLRALFPATAQEAGGPPRFEGAWSVEVWNGAADALTGEPVVKESATLSVEHLVLVPLGGDHAVLLDPYGGLHDLWQRQARFVGGLSLSLQQRRPWKLWFRLARRMVLAHLEQFASPYDLAIAQQLAQSLQRQIRRAQEEPAPTDRDRAMRELREDAEAELRKLFVQTYGSGKARQLLGRKPFEMSKWLREGLGIDVARHHRDVVKQLKGAQGIVARGSQRRPAGAALDRGPRAGLEEAIILDREAAQATVQRFVETLAAADVLRVLQQIAATLRDPAAPAAGLEELRRVVAALGALA